MPSAEKKIRNKNIYKLRISDPNKWTFEELGKEFGVTRQAVSLQLIKFIKEIKVKYAEI